MSLFGTFDFENTDLSLEKRKPKEINKELQKIDKHVFLSMNNKSVLITQKFNILAINNLIVTLFVELNNKYEIQLSEIMDTDQLTISNEMQKLLDIDNKNQLKDPNIDNIISIEIQGWVFEFIDIIKRIKDDYILHISGSKISFSKILGIGKYRYSIYKEIGISYDNTNRYKDFRDKVINSDYYYKKYCLDSILKINELIYENREILEGIIEFKDLLIGIIKGKGELSNIKRITSLLINKYNTNNIHINCNDYKRIKEIISGYYKDDNRYYVYGELFSNGEVISKISNEFKYNRKNKIYQNILYAIKLLKLEKYVNSGNIKKLKDYYTEDILKLDDNLSSKFELNNLSHLYQINLLKKINKLSGGHDSYLINNIKVASSSRIYPHITNLGGLILTNKVITTCGFIRNRDEFVILICNHDKNKLLNFHDLNYYKNSEINKEYYKSINDIVPIKYNSFTFNFNQIIELLKVRKKLTKDCKITIQEFDNFDIITNFDLNILSYFKIFTSGGSRSFNKDIIYNTKFTSRVYINSELKLISSYGLSNDEKIEELLTNLNKIKKDNINELTYWYNKYQECENNFNSEIFKEYFNVSTFKDFIILIISLYQSSGEQFKNNKITITTNQLEKLMNNYNIFINNIKYNKEEIDDILEKTYNLGIEVQYLISKEFKKKMKINKLHIRSKKNLDTQTSKRNKMITPTNIRLGRENNNNFILEILLCNKFYNKGDIKKIYEVMQYVSLQNI